MTDELEWHRAHPLTLLHYFVTSVRQLIFVIFLVLLQVDEGGGPFWLSVVLILVPSLMSVARYLTATYAVDDTNVYFHHGILKRVRQTMPIDNIQNVGTAAPLVARMFGLREVVISGASAEGTITIGLLDVPTSNKVIEMITNKSAISTLEPTTISTLPPPPGFHLPPAPHSAAREVTPSLRTSAEIETEPRVPFPVATPATQPLIISAAGSTTWGGVGAAVWATFILIAMLATRLDGRDDPPFWVGLGGVTALYLVYRATSILNDVVQHWGFRFEVGQRSLGSRDGLLTEITKTAVRDRVQLVDIRSNTLMRHFDVARVYYDTADSSADVASLRDRLLTPAIATDQADDLIAQVIEADLEIPKDLIQVSPLTVRRGRIRWGLASVVIGAITLFANPVVGVPVLAGMAVFTVWQPKKRFQLLGYAIKEPHLHLREGIFERHQMIIRLDKIQSVRTYQSYFQRRLGLADLIFGCGGRHRTIVIPDLPLAEAERLADELARRSAETAFDSTL